MVLSTKPYFTLKNALSSAKRKESKMRKKVSDLWLEERKKIETFYKKLFNLTVDWSRVSMPKPDKENGMNRIEYISGNITEDQALKVYANTFGENSVWVYPWMLYEKSIIELVKEKQARPTGDYVISHRGGNEPDVLDRSYNFGLNRMKFMIPLEGIVAALRYRFETGRMMDVKGRTIFAALDFEGLAMTMEQSKDTGAKFSIGFCYPDAHYPVNGLRQITF